MYRRIKQSFLLGTLNTIASSKHVLKPLCAGTVVELQRPYSWQGRKGGSAALDEDHEQQCWGRLRHSSERCGNCCVSNMDPDLI